MKKTVIFRRFVTVMSVTALTTTSVLAGNVNAALSPETEQDVLSQNAIQESELQAERADTSEPGGVIQDDDVDITWSIDQSGKLTITGYGDADYDKPWTDDAYAPLVKSAVVTVENATDLYGYFWNLTNLESVDLSGTSLGQVTSMEYMFANCKSLKSISFQKTLVNGAERIDTRNVTNMSDMFRGCESLTQVDAGLFFTDQLTDMNWMFYDCKALTNLDLSKWNTQNVREMFGLFSGCQNLQSLNLSGLKTDQVSDFGYMFSGCKSLTSLDLSGFVTTGYYEENIYDEDSQIVGTKQEAYMNAMFEGCEKIKTLDLSKFDTRYVTNMSEMFEDCTSLESLVLPASFTAQNVSNVSLMFAGDEKLTSIDLSPFVKLATSEYEDSVTGEITQRTTAFNMFEGCKSLKTIDLSKLDTSNIYDFDGMFKNCSSLEAIDLSLMDLSKAVDVSNMFSGCESLTAVDLSKVSSAENIISLDAMFFGCKKLGSVNMTGFNPQKAETACYMFSGCEKLASIDLSAWNTAALKDASSMFNGCPSLTAIDLQKNNLSGLTKADLMFGAEKGLVSVKLPAGMNVNIELPSFIDYEWKTSANAIVTTTLKGVGAETYTKTAKPAAPTTTQPTQKPAGETTKSPAAKGAALSSAGGKYKVVSADKTNPTVSYTGQSSAGTKVTVPQSITVDGITYKVVSIQAKCFKGNRKLKQVTVKGNVTEIGASAFEGCSSLQTVTLGAGVKKIGKNAFKNCAKLKKIKIQSTKLTSVGKSALSGIHKKCVIDVPNKKISAYKKLFKKKGQKSSVKIS